MDAAPKGIDSLLGTLVAGRYRIESILGEGGMGIVYRAVHIELDKTVAVKMLRSDIAHDEIVPQRFVQEAKALSRIQHAHIVEVYDFGRMEDGTAYFVMEYLEGRSLREAIRENSLSVPEILRVARAIADGLSAAHAAGVIHRDLKPENIQLVKRDGDPAFVKILDFGVAKVAGVSKLTKNGAIFGTPHYMSPEQAQGLTVDHRSDIYSYGIILYELFTGRLPFDADSFVRVISQQIFEPPPPLEFEPERASLGAFAPLVLGCLEKKISDRYRSFDAVIEALDALERGVARSPYAHPRMRFAMAAMIVVAALIGLIAAWPSPAAEPRAAPAQLATLALSPLEERPAPRVDEGFQDEASFEEPEAAPKFVLIDSDPQGAFISLDGIGIGATPLQIPRPLSGERRLRIEREGRMAQEFLLGSDGPERLVVHLPDRRAKPVRVGASAPARANQSARATVSGVSAPAPETAKPPPARGAPIPKSGSPTRKLGEVVDPWSD